MLVHGPNRVNLAARIKTLKDSRHAPLRGLFILCRFVWRVAGVLGDPDARSVFVVKHFHAERAHQVANATATDRYPDLFSRCRRHFETSDGLKLLSFGCSTGEEVFTLKEYFPRARILGLDINKRSIAICRERNTDPTLEFRVSTDEALSDGGPFDAIFCLAVLQRTETRDPGVQSSALIYPFSKFDAQLRALDARLRPGGLMVVDLCSYLFKDVTIAPKYLALEGSGAWRRLAQYDKDNNRIAHPCYNDRIFVKQQ